jgi:outer membrane lipoprotein-sorting protein
VKKVIEKRIRFVFLALLLTQASCIVRHRTVPADQRMLPAKSATKEELFSGLEDRSKQIRTLIGDVTMDVSGGGKETGVLTEYRQTRGYVFVERPQNIRIKVLLPIVLSTVADMVSDGSQYKLSIPIKNQWSEGNVNARINSTSPVASLRPQHFLDGLFVDVIPYLNKPHIKRTFTDQTEGRRSYYVFTFFDASGEGPELRTLEKLWIDRSDDLEVSRKQVFREDGKIETDVVFSNYHTEGNVRFPEVIEITRPIEDYTLKLTFQSTKINEKLQDNTFALERPEGAELVQVAQ